MPMDDWLSTTWAPNWRSLQYFNLYRLFVAGLFLLAFLFPRVSTTRLSLLQTPASLVLTGGYMVSVIAGLLLSIHWQKRFNLQLSLQVLLDILVVGLVMLGTDGADSGLTVLLLVSLAAASLVGHGRLVLLYAAMATLAVLTVQIYGVQTLGFEETSIMQAGFISACFFATAILARLLGQRAMSNENLARQRGIALDNQIRISQRIVERMQDGVLVVDADGRIIRYNPVARGMLGLAGDGEALPSPLAAGLDQWANGGPESLQFAGFADRRLLARFEHAASSDREQLVFLEDIGRIQERALQMKLASLGRLTASIAHEIRNPLSAISHAGELLREERRGEMHDRLLRILNDNVLRLDRIVQDVLLLGRQNQAQPEAVVLDSFCPVFVEDFVATESLAPEVVTWKPGNDMALCFSPAHLHQILWNLVSNALRHSSRGPGAVRLEAVAVADAAGWVELHVIDDGPGIPDEVREQIFEPFFTTRHTGSGLGLYIARELCAANGGSLSIGANAPGGHFIIAGRNDTCLSPEASADRARN